MHFAGDSHSLLAKVLANQAETMHQVLGRPVQDVSQQPSHAVVIARSDETIGSQDASCSFQVVLTQPTFSLDKNALTQVMQPTLSLCAVHSHACVGLLAQHSQCWSC